MTLSDINTKIDDLTGDTDRVAYPVANRLIDINIWLQKVVGMIFDSQDEDDYDDQRASDYPTKTTPLATTRDYQIPVSEKFLKMKNVSVTYDGTNYYRALPIDDSESERGIVARSQDTTANTTIDAFFAKTAPRYDLKWNALWLYPLASAADVAAGGKIITEWYRQATPFTSTELSTGTVVPGFDDTFHPILAYGPAFEYCHPKGLQQTKAILLELQDYEARLRKQYSTKQGDRMNALESTYPNFK